MGLGPAEGVPKEGSERGPKSPGHIQFYVFWNETMWLKVAPGTGRVPDANPRFEPYSPHVKDTTGLAGANSLKLLLLQLLLLLLLLTTYY